jgi:cobalt-zinc-cadmium efflux system outer membrane protein
LNRHVSRPRSVVACAAISTLISFGLVGCSAPPRVSAERDITLAAGLREPIVFRSVGAPSDEPSHSSAVALTLSEAVGRALRSSPDVQAALARVEAAYADARQARLLPNPILSVVLRWPEDGGPVDVEAGLSADLISLLTIRGRTSAADDRLRAASSEAVSTALDVLAETQQRYVAVQANDELLAVLRDRVGILDRLLGIARSRAEAGEGTRLDVLALDTQRVELQVELRDRQLDRLDQRLALARLIGEPSANIDWTLPPRQPLVLPALSERQWVEAALAGRPEVRQQEYQLAALGADYRLTRLSPFDGVGPGIESERGGGDWAVGPGLTTPLPLFDFGQQRRAKAQALVAEARHKLTRTRRQIIEESRRAYGAFAAGQENLTRVRDELVPLAERRLAQAEAQFRGGQTDVTALLQAEEQLRSARTRLIELERDSNAALFRLQRAVGGPGITSNVATTQTATAGSTTRSATTQREVAR